MQPIAIMRWASRPAVIDVQPGAYSTTVTDPGDAFTSVTYQSNGLAALNSDTESPYSWRVGGSSANYEVRYTATTGTLSAGSTGVWENLSTSRTFEVSRTTVGTKSASGTVEIRRTSDLVVVDSAAISLSATVDP